MFTATLGVRIEKIIFTTIGHSLTRELRTVLQDFLALTISRCFKLVTATLITRRVS